MRVLMFGWEFPPFNSGGLGIACQGLSRALSRQGHDITFVLPKQLSISADYMDLVFADVPRVNIKAVNSLLAGYITEERYRLHLERLSPELASLYGENLYEETHRYGDKARALAKMLPHDVVHAHDWLSFSAGVAAKETSNKPFVAHIHATEFDRTANGNVNQAVYDTERWGMEQADVVMAVSELTKNILIKHYGIPDYKIKVLHNGIEPREVERHNRVKLNDHYKIVLFLGRLTIQKGPDYFLAAAKQVLSKDKNVLFVMTGSGDMARQLIAQAAEAGIAENVIFTGFRRGHEIDRLYQLADVYVMPSISEPFGITALESILNKTPIIVSKQSGVREVIPDAIQVDFWNTHDLADKILAVLSHQAFAEEIGSRQRDQLLNVTWEKAAALCSAHYCDLVPAAP